MKCYRRLAPHQGAVVHLWCRVGLVDSTLPPAAPFNLFEPATEAEISTLIYASQNKQCDIDPIPTSINLLKECATRGVHSPEAMMHFPLVSDSPYSRKISQTPSKIFPVLPLPRKISYDRFLVIDHKFEISNFPLFSFFRPNSPFVSTKSFIPLLSKISPLIY